VRRRGEAGTGRQRQAMSVLFLDTTPEAERMLVELLREASPARKLHTLGELNATARLLARAGLRSRYPGASEAELDCRLADLLLGPELAARAYGPAPFTACCVQP
jgi:hypothetical protein